jgi:hypothetical protein
VYRDSGTLKGRAKMSANGPKTLSVPEAGWIYYGLRSAKASYQAAKRGDIPTIKVGNRLRVPVVAMDAKLAEAGRCNRANEGNKVAA